jgi:hypothetical protein
MQTFILRNGNNQDVQLLLDISKKLGLDLELQSPFFLTKQEWNLYRKLSLLLPKQEKLIIFLNRI